MAIDGKDDGRKLTSGPGGINEATSAGELLLRSRVKGDAFDRYQMTVGGTALVGDGTVRPNPTTSVGVVEASVYGVAADGVSNDTAALALAVAAIPAAGGVLQLPSGVIVGSLTINKPNVTVRGRGMWATTLKAPSAVSQMVSVTGSSSRGHLVFEDMAFDMDVQATNALVLYPDDHSVRVRRVRFWKPATSCVTIAGAVDVEFDACLFHSPGTGVGTGLSVNSAPRRLSVRNSRFFYLYAGIVTDTGSTTSQTEEVAEEFVVDNNYFDGAWWLLVSSFAGSGANVSYTSTTVTDTGAAFAGIAAEDVVRSMAVKQTGTGTYFYTRIIDGSATFVANGVERGDIVRAGTRFGVVVNVQSETILWVEEWLNDADRLPGAVPSGAYTVYGVALGKVASSTSTSITVDRWHDFDGNAVTPAAQARYEVTAHPNYPLHAEYSARLVRVSGNVFKRGWADQISLYGYQAQVVNNIVEDGRDFGLTIHGEENIITGNRVRHQGAAGIATTEDSAECIVANNTCSESPWVNAANTTYLADIIISGDRNTASNNVVKGGAGPLHRHGIVVNGLASGTNDANRLLGNTATGTYSVAGVRLQAAASGTVSNTVLRNNVGVVSVSSNATGTDYDIAGPEWLIDVDVLMTSSSATNWNSNTIDTAAFYNGRKGSTGAQNAEVNYDVVLSAGTWTIEVMHFTFTDAGIMSVQLDDGAGVFAEVGTIDTYSAALTRNVRTSITGVAVTATARKRRLKLKMTDKNASSTNYAGYIQHVQLRRTA